MRTIAVLAVVLAGLVAAAPAAAKELTLTICGADGCRNVTDPSGTHELLVVGGPAEAPSAATFYGVTVRATGSAGLVRAFLYVPSEGVMRVDDATSYWTTVPPALRAALDEAVAPLAPYPASSGWDPAASIAEPFPWLPAGAAAVALALLAAALARIRRRRLAAMGAAALVLLALPATAAAKAIAKAELCGPAGCATLTDRAKLRTIASGAEFIAGPPPVAPYHTLRFTAVHEGERETWSIYYVRSTDVLAVPGEHGSLNYHPILGRARTLLRRLASKVEPFPAPVLTGATVDGRSVSGDPSTYLRLFDAQSAGAAITGDEEWLRIELASRAKSPWTNDAVYVAYAPGAKLLQRGLDLVRLPDELAADVEAGRALGAGGRGRPWLLVAGLAAAASILAAAVRRVRRRRLAAVGVTAVAAALALPGVASAKGYGPVRLCGPAACSSTTGLLPSLPAYGLTGAPPAAPFYELGPRRRAFSTGWYVPSARATAPRAGSSFTRVTQDASAVLDRLAGRLEPFPAPTVVAAFVGDRRVTGDAGTYLRLFELAGPAPAASGGADWVPISLYSKRDTPWTNGAAYLLYSPSQDLLQRGRELIRVDALTASRLDRAADLDGGGSALPWLLLAALAGVLTFFAALAAVVRRQAEVRTVARPTPA